MKKALMINAESSDFCGISDTFVFWTETEDEEIALNEAMEQYGNEMDEHLIEYYDEDDLEELNDGPSFSHTAEWFSEKAYGEVGCAAYIQLNAPDA